MSLKLLKLHIGMPIASLCSSVNHLLIDELKTGFIMEGTPTVIV